jgi:hypothetical protein
MKNWLKNRELEARARDLMEAALSSALSAALGGHPREQRPTSVGSNWYDDPRPSRTRVWLGGRRRPVQEPPILAESQADES